MKHIIILVLAFLHFAQATELVISKSAKVEVLLEGGKPILIAPISLGKEETPTPAGSYTVEAMERHTMSRKYNCPMSDCLRMQDGYCVHESDTSGPSAGCVRQDRFTADSVYGRAKVGMKVTIVDLFTGDLAKFNNFDRRKIELRGNWPALPNTRVSAVLRHLNSKAGGNKAGRDVHYPIDKNALAMIVGGQLATTGLLDKGAPFGDVHPAIKAHLAGIPAEKSACRRYVNFQSGQVTYYFNGGDYFLSWPLEQVNEALDAMNAGFNHMR